MTNHLTQEEARAALAQALDALEQIIEEKCDYMRRNYLGNPEVEHTVKYGRAAIAAGREALETQGDADETAWLVEFDGKYLSGVMEDSKYIESIQYLCIKPAHAGFGKYELTTTPDASMALRLARREDAELLLNLHMPKHPTDEPGSLLDMRKHYRAAEHMWLAAHPQASEPALSTEDQCFCDANNLGVRGVSCGDCPRDYKQEPAPSTARYSDIVSDGGMDPRNSSDEAAAALLKAQPKRESLTNVMTWNEMYQRLDFLNGRPIAAYSASELMQIEIRELRKALEAAHKIGGQG